MTTTEPTTALHTSYLTLDARHSTVRAAAVDAHLMHRLIMSGWRTAILPTDSTPRTHLDVLYAIDRGPAHQLRVVAQANTAPEWNFDTGILIGTVEHRIRTAPLTGTINFQLTAAPTKSIPSTTRHADGTRPRGKRVPAPATEYERWAQRALARAGLDVHTLDVRVRSRIESERKSLPRHQRATPNAVFAHTTVTYTGTATVTDPDAHHSALRRGIGPAKSYGCGLLLTRPSANR
ncbi:MAG: type I-E CRISPR-associated protein Cas6/Cse3/CasE [Rhodococcus sp. (in: high G+C Gram-positive bacteria)]|uniref:type I-E CRISPR-associated protein Cas6/Cse3/CasE n=1 Tax=Rhodococcus sp. TaxID=1831 RepID=UPI003BB7381A